MNYNKLDDILKNDNIPDSIKEALFEVQEEPDEFAATAIASLAEEILNFLSALAISAYLTSKNQTDSFNQRLLDLFYTDREPHANSVFILVNYLIDKIGRDDNGYIIKEKLTNHYIKEKIAKISRLRNQLMHGIFVLPPAKNLENLAVIIDLLEGLFNDGFASMKIEGDSITWENIRVNPFFILKDNKIKLTENWAVLKDNNNLKYFESKNQFESLINQVKRENSPEFISDENGYIKTQEPSDEIDLIDLIFENLKTKEKGAILIHGGFGCGKTALWASICKKLEPLENFHIIPYRIQSTGRTYSSKILKYLIINKISELSGVGFKQPKDNENEKIRNFIENNISKIKGKIIVTIDDVHIHQFNPEHLLSSIDLLYKNNSRLVATSYAYSSLFQYFNDIYSMIKNPKFIKDSLDWESIISGYTINKGPNPEYPDQKNDYDRLKEAVNYLYDIVLNENSINLRKLADRDDCQYSLELLEESAQVLSPFIKHSREAFEKDVVDEITGLPVKETDSSFIYRILGRRDIELEYESPVITLS